MSAMGHRNRQLVRMFHLIALLRAFGGCTLERLSLELGVTTRTVRRDLEALQASGVPLYSVSNEDVGDKGALRWRLVKGASCTVCGRATLRGDELRRSLAASDLHAGEA